jgi:hypothetical protein
MLEKWYGLFPTNPYARISALLPLTILFSIMIIPSLLQYIYGYRYNPNVADDFSDTLTVVRENLTNQNLFVEEEDYRFYKILEASSEIKVFDSNTEWTGEVAVLKNIEEKQENYQLSRIITSPKVDNSDIIYLYVEKGE